MKWKKLAAMDYLENAPIHNWRKESYKCNCSTVWTCSFNYQNHPRVAIIFQILDAAQKNFEVYIYNPEHPKPEVSEYHVGNYKSLLGAKAAIVRKYPEDKN